MEEHINQFLIFIFIFIIPGESACDYIIPSPPEESCKPVSCDSIHGPLIRFPFRLKNRQPARCGYPGFDLHCNPRNQTVITLPKSGDFIVYSINYLWQDLLIADPGSCLANRALNFSLSGSPFTNSYCYRNDLVFLNCSGGQVPWSSYYEERLSCLNRGNKNTVAAVWPWARIPPSCRRIGSVSLPPWWWEGYFEVYWNEPYCKLCEVYGGTCRFKDRRVGCSKRCALSRSAKIRIILAFVIPVLCVISLALCYLCYLTGMFKSVVAYFSCAIFKSVKVWNVRESS